MGQHSIGDLEQMQSLPLSLKVQMTKRRIQEWYEHWDGNIYVSFSGGKDSTVLLHITRQIYPDVKAVFIDTGLEYPEIREFVKSYDNVEWIRPKLTFRQVIEKYGYPFISKEVSECVVHARRFFRERERESPPYAQFYRKLCGLGEYATPDQGGGLSSGENYEEMANLVKEQGTARAKMLMGVYPSKTPGKWSAYNQTKWQFFLEAPFEISNQCCYVMKKSPAHTYGHRSGLRPMTAQMASESRLRKQKWLKNGCNGFDMKEPISNPMSFWTEQDVLAYIYLNNLPIAPVYGEVVPDRECLYPLADMTRDDKDRPIFSTTGCDRTGCMFCGYGCHLEKGEGRFERMKRTHPKQYDFIMRPKEKGGLNYKEVIDWINEHGNTNIRY